MAALPTTEISKAELFLGVTKGVEMAHGGRGAAVDGAPLSCRDGGGKGRAHFDFGDMISPTKLVCSNCCV